MNAAAATDETTATNQKTYVVPLDGSPLAERALSIAAVLQQRTGGSVLLVSAEYRGPLEPRWYLTELAARFPNIPTEVHPHLEQTPADAILEVVGETDDRVVCMTSHGRGRLRWSMVGSTAEEIIRRSDRPVLLVGRHCRDDFLRGDAHLLACVDGTEPSERIAPVALEWAERLGIPTDAAVVVNPLDVESAEHPETLLDPIVAHFGGRDRVRTHLLTSSYVAGALADFADDLPAGLVAISSYGRTGLARLALGSVTMAVLNLLACPVLVTHCPT